jgi:integrase
MPRETDFTEYDESTITFLNSFNKGTKATYKAYFKLFLIYTNMTGQQILESRKADKSFEWETIVLKFKQWMKTQKAKNGEFYSDNAVSTAVNAVRSFFDHYHTKLNFNHNEARKLNGKPERTTKDYNLTNPILEKMAFVANLRDKYIVLLGKSLGLRASDFITLTYGDFRAIDLNEEPPIFIREIITKKEKVKANLFIDADAQPIIKQVIDSNKDKSANERIITVHEDELSTIIQRLAEKANIDIGDTHLRFHCFRKYLIDRLKGHMSESAWKQIVGKAISEGAYVSTFELKECYTEVMKLTTIYKDKGNAEVSKVSDQVTELSKILSEKSQELAEQRKKMEDIKTQYGEENKTLRDRLKKIEDKLTPKQTGIPDLTDEEEKEMYSEIDAQNKAYRKWEEEHPEIVKKRNEELDKLNEEYTRYREQHPEIEREEQEMFNQRMEKEIADLRKQLTDALDIIKNDKKTESHSENNSEA